MSGNQSLETLQREMRRCRLCLDAGYDIEPGAVFSGGRAARAMLVGQAPGRTEAETGRPFNAGSGRRLFQWLAVAGWEEATFRARHYMTAVTKCYPGPSDSGKGDRLPGRAEQKLCAPFLAQELALIRPRLLLLVGGVAIKQLYPQPGPLRQVIGSAARFPLATDGTGTQFEVGTAEVTRSLASESPEEYRWMVPLPHPSGASLWPNRPENKALIDRALALLGALRIALEL